MSGEDRGETWLRNLETSDDFGSDSDDGGDDAPDDELSVGANVFSTQTIYSAVVTDIFGNRNDRPGDEPAEEVENPGGEVEVTFDGTIEVVNDNDDVPAVLVPVPPGNHPRRLPMDNDALLGANNAAVGASGDDKRQFVSRAGWRVTICTRRIRQTLRASEP